jgi:hypothetical protein
MKPRNLALAILPVVRYKYRTGSASRSKFSGFLPGSIDSVAISQVKIYFQSNLVATKIHEDLRYLLSLAGPQSRAHSCYSSQYSSSLRKSSEESPRRFAKFSCTAVGV